MTTFAPSAAPPSALRVWADAKSIYAELPTKAGMVPYVTSFPRDSAGLSKLINLIYGNAEVSGPIGYQPPRKLVGTIPQHNLAEAMLRRKGIIK